MALNTCPKCHRLVKYRHPVEGGTYEPMVCKGCGKRWYEWRSEYAVMSKAEKTKLDKRIEEEYKKHGLPKPIISNTISASEIYFPM